MLGATMRGFALLTAVLGMVAMAGACGAGPGEGAPASGIRDLPELPQGCHWECSCEPGEECQEGGCVGVCPTGEVCGEAICPDGQVCCNASCGICATPDGWCIQDTCGPVEH